MITLEIYKAKSGQYAGRVIRDGEEIMGIGGCKSVQEVEEAAYDQGYDEFDEIDIAE